MGRKLIPKVEVWALRARASSLRRCTPAPIVPWLSYSLSCISLLRARPELLSGAPGGGAVEASEAEWSTEGQAGLRARRRAWPSVPTGLVPLIQVVLVDQSRVALMIAQRPRRGDRLITSSRPRKARSASELGDGPGLPYRSASCQSSGSFWSTRAVGL